MSAPRRIQRKRTKGWRKPPGAFDVTRTRRGNKWANPYKLADYDRPSECLSDYGAHLDAELAGGRLDLEELRGKDLMCWCPIGAPCHADLLLEAANAPETTEGRRRRLKFEYLMEGWRDHVGQLLRGRGALVVGRVSVLLGGPRTLREFAALKNLTWPADDPRRERVGFEVVP